jgi:hypothetical protein
MSYTIEYARQIFKMPAGTLIPAGYGKIEHTLSQDELFMFVKRGDNNIHPRPQNWHLSAWGWEYSLIQRVCEYAGLAESGCLKFTNGDTTPEHYLKMYRKEIANAVEFSVETLNRLTGIYGGYLCLGEKKNDEPWIQRNIDQIKERFRNCGTYFDYQRYGIAFKTTDDFRAYVHYAHSAKETGGFIGVDSLQNM